MGLEDDYSPASLAQQVFELARSELVASLRFMSTAVTKLSFLPLVGTTLATDGRSVRYDPASILQAYTTEPAALTRAYLHLVLHNVFLHPFPGAHLKTDLWDVACDIAVEHTITELALPATQTMRTLDQRPTLQRIEASIPVLTAETIYRYLDDLNLDSDELNNIHEAFYVDDHRPWHRMTAEAQHKKDLPTKRTASEQDDQSPATKATKAGKKGTETELPADAAQHKRSHSSSRGMTDDDITQKQAPQNAARTIAERFADTVNLDRSKEQWENAALEMGIALDRYTKLWGINGSNLAMNLRSVTRKKHDYGAFLRRFARMGEQIHVNDDEFDYIYYCFGLTRYGNLPLIEPLEYIEQRRIRDFVIAIDTSSSTKDGLVRRFIERTYSLLRNETSFAAHMNVLVVQCDAAITDVTPLHSLADLHTYLDTLEIKGLGGTDFRPVFDYVEQLRAQGSLPNLGGLVYFTDAQGTFPKHRPHFETAFVFVDDASAQAATLPPWAISVVLDDTLTTDTSYPLDHSGLRDALHRADSPL